MNGQPIPGLWIDRTGMYEARRRGEKVKKADFTERLELRLSPLPCWSDLDPLEYRRRVAQMVKAIEDETWERHHLLGTKPMGPEKILKQSPYAKPITTKTSKAPRFHTATPEAWIEMMASYRDFAAAFRQAAQLLKDGVFNAKFPEGSFPPGRPFVAHAARAPG